MVAKSYLRYAPGAIVGLVAGTGCNVLTWGDNGEYAVAAALENVTIWDVRKGTVVRTFAGEKHEVTCMTGSHDGVHLAVGYSDGSVRIWDSNDGTCTVTLSGHKAAVTALSYDTRGLLLCSGSKDCDVIVWDVVAETGMYRLRGHKDQITQVHFMANSKILVTSSKDTHVKVWDLDIQHCMQTLVGHRSEVWGFVINQDETRMISGTMDEDMKLWAIGVPAEKEESDGPKATIEFTLLGSVPRKGRERVVTIALHQNGKYLVVQGADKLVEIYRLRSEKEIEKRLKRRAKRQREKKSKNESNQAEETEISEIVRTPSDEIEFLHTIAVGSKVRSVDWLPKAKAVKGQEDTEEVQLIMALNNNTLELHNITIAPKSTEGSQVATVDLPGHRSGVRAMTLSSDDKLLASCCNNYIKVWNISTKSCIRTFPVSYALTLEFMPGNRHLLIGTKSGEIHLFDIGAASVIQTEQAHEGAVWTLAIRPDRRGFASGSADKEVKFWDFDLIDDAEYSKTAKRLGFAHTSTLKMSDDVLAVKYSPDNKLIAVSLLDCTVKIFFSDSLKFFTSLYGHKLPVLSMDISADSTLIVTASADKNIKFWGLDFGDCHRSIFAHSDSIMAVTFVADTHYVFTVSKDRTVKYWDGDTFEHVLTLNGHHAEVWCGVASKYGHLFISGSHDRSIRFWERTDDQVILEEERETERDLEHEKAVAEENKHEKGADDDGSEAVAPGKRTLESVKGAESIIEAIELADQETAAMTQWKQDCDDLRAYGNDEAVLPAPPQKNVIMKYLNIESPDRYVLYTVQRIHPNELDQALLVLPFNQATRLLNYVNTWLEKGWETELAGRCLLFLLQIHQNQLVATKTMLETLDSLRVSARSRMSAWK
eukprot:Ihof_evm8s65 gene=Ihof_evmTU8s65